MTRRIPFDAVADRPADVTVSEPTEIARGFMPYERYSVILPDSEGRETQQRRDLLRAGRVVAVLTVDLDQDRIVLIRQFRLSGHIATGRGDMVEIVAGRVDRGESPRDAAIRECREEIGVAPSRIVELFSVLSTPGLTEEYVTFFLGTVDSSKVVARGGLDGEGEDTLPFVVSIGDALAALDRGSVANALLVNALQWLARHRAGLRDYITAA